MTNSTFRRCVLRAGALGVSLLLGTGLAAGVALADNDPAAKAGGTYRGVVFGDLNGDKAPDDNEVLEGAGVTISNTKFNEHFEKATGPNGEFEFTGLEPQHTFQVEVHLKDWVFPKIDDFTVDGTDDPAVQILAVRPLKDTLAASITFLRDVYDVGDTAHLRVVLTNSGKTAAENIRAACAQHGGSDLDGLAAGWGELRFTEPGVTIEPGTTRTIEVTDTVPAVAGERGFVHVFCAFEKDGTDISPFAFDSANISGRTGTGHGKLVQDLDGDKLFDNPVPNTKVVLIDPARNVPVAKAVTDANGDFDTPVLTAKLYQIVVVGPWQPDLSLMVLPVTVTPEPNRRDFHLKPGPAQADPLPDPTTEPTPTTPASPAAPQPQGANTPAELAATGSSVDGLVVLSLGLLAAGVGAVLAGRRRRADQS